MTWVIWLIVALAVFCIIFTFWLCHRERAESREFADLLREFDGIHGPP